MSSHHCNPSHGAPDEQAWWVIHRGHSPGAFLSWPQRPQCPCCGWPTTVFKICWLPQIIGAADVSAQAHKIASGWLPALHSSLIQQQHEYRRRYSALAVSALRCKSQASLEHPLFEHIRDDHFSSASLGLSICPCSVIQGPGLSCTCAFGHDHVPGAYNQST